MSRSGSCSRCAKFAAFLSPSGLCLECEATDQSVGLTPRVPMRPDPAQAPTATAALEGSTAAEAPDDFAALPTPPAGYDILEQLGAGGMGVVYLAHEQAADRVVAMKFLHFPGDSSAHDRFLVELRALANLDHPNIVRVLASDFLRADPYFTMEYMPNGSLARAVKDGGRMPVTEAVRVVRAVAGALAAVHARQLVHRDVKPSNILLAADGTPKLSDFGLAKQLEGGAELTAGSGALGTASYMPPEQISRKNGDIGPWSDVYSLGATLYHLLTGRAPFAGETTEETILHVLADPPPRPRGLCPDLPAALEGIVLKCLEKDPKDRYQSAADLAADLDRFTAGEKPLAPVLTPARRLRRWARRNRRALVASALVACAFVLLAAFWPKPPDPAELKARRLKAIRDDVLIDKTVTILGESGTPAWHEWLLGKVELGESPTGDGACYFQAAGGGSLLQLFDPPRDRYRLSLQLQQIGAELGPDPTVPSVGFFLGHTTYNRPAGPPARGFLLIDFLDFDRAAAAGRAPAPPPLRFGWQHLVPPPGGMPNPQHLMLKQDTFPAKGTFPGDWWTFVAEVSPDAVVIRWSRGGAPEKELANLRRADIRDALRIYKVQAAAARQAAPNVDFGPLPDDWNPAGGAGIWCVRSRVAFKNVVVSPLP